MLLLLLFVLVALVCSSPPSSSSPLLFRLLLLLFLLSEVEFVCVGGSGVAFVGGLLLHKKKMVCKVTHSRTVQVCVCVSVCIPLCMCASVVVCVRFLRLFIFMMFPFWHFIEEVYRRHCCCCINK